MLPQARAMHLCPFFSCTYYAVEGTSWTPVSAVLYPMLIRVVAFFPPPRVPNAGICSRHSGLYSHLHTHHCSDVDWNSRPSR